MKKKHEKKNSRRIKKSKKNFESKKLKLKTYGVKKNSIKHKNFDMNKIIVITTIFLFLLVIFLFLIQQKHSVFILKFEEKNDTNKHYNKNFFENNSNNSFLNKTFYNLNNSIEETINFYVEKQKNFVLYDPYNKILYYGVKINKSNPCNYILSRDYLEVLDKNIIKAYFEEKSVDKICIQTIKEEYVFRKSIFLQKPDFIKVYHEKNVNGSIKRKLVFESKIEIFNSTYKIDSYEKLNFYCQNFPENRRAECCSENSDFLIRPMCVGSWIWNNGCQFKCGVENIK